MIKVVPLKCPGCGANLSVEEGRKQCFCQYCGTKIIIDDGSTTHTYRKVDEARMKEAEAEKLIRLKELEIEENKRVSQEKNKVMKIKASILLGIVGSILLVVGFAAGNATGNPESALYYISFIGLFALMTIGFIWF